MIKKIAFPLLVGLIMASCSCHHSGGPGTTVTTVDKGAQGAGLNLQALGELVKKSPSPAALEQTLNTAGSINNLDLDHDGKVDYIKVSEVPGAGNIKTLKFTDEATNGTKTEVADVTINPSSDTQATMNVSGNQSLYGSNNTFQSVFMIGGSMLMGYLLAPHTNYSSPYGGGSYPPNYAQYAPASAAAYRNTVSNYTSHPTGSLAAPVPARGLSGATGSQHSFGVRDAMQKVASGGFGSHSSSGSTASASPTPPPPSSSSSSQTVTRGFGKSKRH